MRVGNERPHWCGVPAPVCAEHPRLAGYRRGDVSRSAPGVALAPAGAEVVRSHERRRRVGKVRPVDRMSAGLGGRGNWAGCRPPGGAARHRRGSVHEARRAAAPAAGGALRPAGDRRRRHRLRQRARCGHARVAGGAGGARRLRQRHQQPQHQAGTRRRALPGTGGEADRPHPVPPGARGAARAAGAAGAGAAPGARTADLRAAVSTRPASLLPDRPAAVRPPGRQVCPAPLRIRAARACPHPLPLPARGGARPRTAAPPARGRGVLRRPVRRRAHESRPRRDRRRARRRDRQLPGGGGVHHRFERPHHRRGGARSASPAPPGRCARVWC